MGLIRQSWPHTWINQLLSTPNVGRLGHYPNMSPSLRCGIVLKVGGIKTIAKSLFIPMCHLLAAYLSIGYVHLKRCGSIVDIIWWPILLLAISKWTLLHQVPMDYFAICGPITLSSSNKARETRHVSWSGLQEPICKKLVQSTWGSNRVPRILVRASVFGSCLFIGLKVKKHLVPFSERRESAFCFMPIFEP